MAEGKYTDAALELRSAIKLNPQLPEAHYQLALAYLHMGFNSGCQSGIEPHRPSPAGQPDGAADPRESLNADRAEFSGSKSHGRTDTSARRFEYSRSDSACELAGGNYRVKRLDCRSPLLPSSWNQTLRLLIWISVSNSNFQRQPEMAEAAYRQAIAADPRSILPHLASGQFLSCNRNEWRRLKKNSRRHCPLDPVVA